MTLRIERTSDKRGTRLHLSGELRCGDLDQVKAEISRSTRPVALDLGEVNLVDLAGVCFLNACRAGGVAVLQCSPYIREWMLRERAACKKGQSINGAS